MNWLMLSIMKQPKSLLKSGGVRNIGFTGGTAFSNALETLGLNPNDRIEVTRHLPPMEYITVIEPGERVLLNERMAARIWGRMDDRLQQFVSARVGRKFQVVEILGGRTACRLLCSRGIEPGRTLILEAVAPAQTLQQHVRNPVIITGREGLRLFLEPADGKRLFVRLSAEAAPGTKP